MRAMTKAEAAGCPMKIKFVAPPLYVLTCSPHFNYTFVSLFAKHFLISCVAL